MAEFKILESSQTVLLVIDIQRALFTRPNPIPRDFEMIETVNALVDRAHLYGLPVVYVQHANDSFLKEGSDGWKLHPALKPLREDYSVHKKVGNAFQAPALMSVIEARDIKNVIVTGLVSQGCIRATSLGGLQLGLEVFLVKGAHSNYDRNAEGVIEKVENELAGAGVQVVSAGELAFH